MTTDQKEFIECAYNNVLPPTYERRIAKKEPIIEDNLWEYDIKTFKSRIGLITNIGTQLFAMLPLFEKDSDEYKEILNRLKICNCFQSMEIDRAKGIKTMDIPRYWTKWDKVLETDNEEDKKVKLLHQKTIAEKRPYFFRYLYKDYERKYKKWQSAYDKYSMMNFGLELNELLEKENKTKEEQKVIDNYFKFDKLLASDCVMNNVCHYMESKVREIKQNNKLRNFDFKSLLSDSEKFKPKNRLVIQNIYNKYREYKQSVNYHSSTTGFHEMMQWLRNQSEPIVNDAKEIVYWGSDFGSSFLLDVFPLALVDVLREKNNNSILIPVLSENGYARYMNKKYEIVRLDL